MEIRHRFGVQKPPFRTLKFSDSLDYANRWRIPHTEPACHGDRKSYSTRCEISTPGSSDSLDYANRWRSHTRSRPVTAIGSCVQLITRSPPQVIDIVARTSLI
ncbi:hypothetical protein Taro_006203 [Colocasia esculenta]|uniref:Uncharacterized protein n=1 Tax=Colocasia esculenta TaxID=4460 RepID=A0A843TUQ3_COLES|nr:hypothetical protein [Colocasia esculenta]